MVSMPRQMTAMFSAQKAKKQTQAPADEDGLAADPGLYAEPPAGNQGAEHGGDVGAAHAEGGADEDRKGNAVFGARMCVEQHGDEHDQVAEEDGADGLPPAHTSGDQAAREHIGGNADGHRHPEGSVIVDAPRALRWRDGRQVLVVERGVVLHYFQAPPRAVRFR